MTRPRSFRLKLLAACLLLAAAVILSRSLWLPWLGWALVHDDGPAKADIAVVLGGDFEIAYAVRLGFPAQWFIALPHSALSTEQEAPIVLAELRRRNVRSFLLVTSDYHTARARRTFLAAERAMAGGPIMRTVAVPGDFFHPDSWWRNREGQKIAFFEWSKTLAFALGI